MKQTHNTHKQSAEICTQGTENQYDVTYPLSPF